MKGFSIESTTPSFIAATAISISPCLVIITTASWRRAAQWVRTSSMPSSSGMRASISAHAGFRFGTSSTKSIGMEFYQTTGGHSVVANLFDEEKRSGGRRIGILAGATLVLGTGRNDIFVGDLSQNGVRIFGGHKLVCGNSLCLQIEAIGLIDAEVRWADATKAGLLFDARLPLWHMMRCIKNGKPSPSYQP